MQREKEEKAFAQKKKTKTRQRKKLYNVQVPNSTLFVSPVVILFIQEL